MSKNRVSAQRSAPPPLGKVALWLRVKVPRTYLTRFSWLLALLTVGIVPFAVLWSPGMFRSLLIVDAGGLKWIALFATASALTVMATRRIVLLHGPERFDLRWPDVPHEITVGALARHFLIALPLIVSSGWLTHTESGVSLDVVVKNAFSGVGYALSMVLVATAFYALHTDKEDDLPDLVVPSNPALKAVHRVRVPSVLAPQVATPALLVRGLRWVRALMGPGYFAPSGRYYPAHLFAIALLLVFSGFYVLGYVRWRPGTEPGAETPAMVYVLIAATLATWLLGAVAFFLDRHRLPTLLPLVGLSAAVWYFSTTDHYFEWSPDVKEPIALATPAQMVAETSPPLLAVVAVDGGGIQASGWATTVLTRLQQSWPGFRRSARLVSAVSGGSVATMFFVSHLRRDYDPSPADLAFIRELGRRGSLNEAAWGVAYPDLWRAFLPLPRGLRARDRGWAVEQAWRRDWKYKVPMLSELRRGVREGWRPAIALNAVGVESGQRVVFASFAPLPAWHLDTLDKIYGGGDVSVSTAARLSATFPYVTPIARADVPERFGIRTTHFADGGYYDNTGMGIAMRWLDAALQGNEATYRGRSVAFIRIRSAPEGSTTPRRDRGWAYETVGPIQTILSVRVAGQQERARTELDFVTRLWCAKGVEIRDIEFGFDQPAPLSWQLTRAEREALDREWTSPKNRGELWELLELSADSTQSRCP